MSAKANKQKHDSRYGSTPGKLGTGEQMLRIILILSIPFGIACILINIEPSLLPIILPAIMPLCVCVCVCVLHRFATPWTVAYQACQSMEFSKQYWSGLPFSAPRNLPDPGVESTSPVAPSLAGRFCTTVPPGKPAIILRIWLLMLSAPALGPFPLFPNLTSYT